MISFAKPRFTFSFSLPEEIGNLRELKLRREIPDKDTRHLLICSWNIANLGLQLRGTDHYQLIAEILSWFDIIAIQEVHDNLDGIFELENSIGTEYGLMFNDRGGNDERAAYFYDTTKIERLQMVGELAISPSKHKHIKLPTVNQSFTGFDRNPYMNTS